MANSFLLRFTMLLLVSGFAAAAGQQRSIVARYPVPGDGGFDYVTFDAKSKRLFLSHATKVDVVDSETGKVLGVIADTPGVHGVALANEFHHGFTSNGAEHKVSMFDSKTLRLIRKIDVGKGPDGIYYHPATKRVFTNNHGSHDITAIDAKSGKVVGTVAIKGDGEQAVFGSDGLVYVNSEDTNEVVAFDPKSLEVKRRLPLGGVAQIPTGLAFDAKNQRLFVACRKEPKLLVMDAVSGRVITSLPIGGVSDWAEYADGMVYVSTGEGILNVFRQRSADVYEDAGAVRTQPSAKTMALDRKSGRIFLPAGEYQFTPAAEAGKPPRRSIKPGSFVVLVVAGKD